MGTAVKCLMSTLSNAVGIGVVNKLAFEERLDHIAQSVVCDTIAKRRSRDEAHLGVVDVEAVITAVAVDAAAQFIAKL